MENGFLAYVSLRYGGKCYLGMNGCVAWPENAVPFPSIEAVERAIAERGWENTTSASRWCDTAYAVHAFSIKGVI